MKNIYRKLSLAICAMIIICSICLTGFAASVDGPFPNGTFQFSLSGQSNFSYDWKRARCGDSNRAVIEYGFDTTFFDEDFASSIHYTNKHYTAVTNSSGTVVSKSASAGNWTNKAQIRHYDHDKVTYRCEF